MSVKGYKVFNPDWTCRGKRYSCPGVFEDKVDNLQICERGIHFCTNISDCFSYYPFTPKNKVAEVEAVGRVKRDNKDTKCCTDKLKIIRELAWDEVLRLCNSGTHNSGNYNSGNYNSGDCNSGNWNSGDYNSGDWNRGDCNSGDWNSGRWNSGDWNSGSWNSGLFCTNKKPTITMFDKESDWTMEDWNKCEARNILREFTPLLWISAQDMTKEEKQSHPEHKTTGGFLRKNDIQKWWDSLSDADKETVRSLPNFDKEKFKQCTGIDS